MGSESESESKGNSKRRTEHGMREESESEMSEGYVVEWRNGGNDIYGLDFFILCENLIFLLFVEDGCGEGGKRGGRRQETEEESSMEQRGN